MGLSDFIRDRILNFLRLVPAQKNGIRIVESLTFDENCFKNKTWYNGDANELNQFYTQIPNNDYRFWGAVPTAGIEIRKIHVGIPKLIVNTLVSITLSDLQEIKFEDAKRLDVWSEITKENNFIKQLRKATKQMMVQGDGAWKISFDESISMFPILEFYEASRIDVIYSRGRLNEISYFDIYTKDKKQYLLKESRGYGYIRYKLYRDDKEVPLDSLEETSRLIDVEHDPSFICGVFCKYADSERWQGRGESIYESKTDNFDALDEAWSQWMDALRNGRSKTYIPEILIPRNHETGELLKPNAFDNRFIKIGSNMDENIKNHIDVKQPEIPTDRYLETYITALDLCLQGLISPSTLGIDTKKLDNAEAQREKEKTTLYSRQYLIEMLTESICDIINITFKAYDTLRKTQISDTKASVTFGEYANPSFEAVIQTLSNPNTPMSLEAKIEELWGKSKDENWKKVELQRLKEEQGMVSFGEPGLDNGVNDG